MPANGRKDHPISMRLPESDLALIDRAASLRGRSHTDFVREAAVLTAEEVLMDQRLIRLGPEAFAEFLDIISAPATVVPEIVAIARRRPPWEAEDDEG
ncbi:DUF1778 domain-containing protein [Methylobacterium frigidaeris]|uniref:DUF1778 domain-containing protein n=1 Tax=Methylobacterium frigidaeris TaxID=2038277 RepID=A0AA37HDN0_9HYPH|nr:DUF1778 domain-containing protein [Methylobacterium frigidaeris]PIK74644.1 hypothetical protein CS379_01345 [Methylobacterium frigidaeris]GJD64081.1 hypothetical protein MPEAHAMD_4255 [Methylobacterium frigidaeris]